MAAFDMQFATHILQGGWTEPAGWALIVAGLALAAWTLLENDRPRRGPALGRRLPGPWTGRPARIDPGSEWQRLAAIVESAIARAETLPSLHARAVAEVEAADDAVSRLLSECATAAAALPPGQQTEPTPAPLAHPLAA